MASEFSVHLGGGLYMDSNGVLSHGPEPGKPVYATPGGGFPIPLDAVAKAAQGLAKFLPNKDDQKSRQKFDKILDGVNMTVGDQEALINTLQAASAVASVIGSVVPVVGAALAVLTLLLELFKEGPSALELLITHRFDDLERKVKALEVQIQQRDLRNQRTAIAKALAAIANFLVELKHTPPDPVELLLRRQDVRNQVDLAGTATRNLLDSSTWLASFNASEYQRVWLGMSHRLFTFPDGAAPLRAFPPAQGANTFDHRLMVPLTIYAVTSYLTLLRALAPEARSTRQNREDLWDFAGALEILVKNMRAEGLARTVYTAADFKDGAAGGVPWGFGPEEVVDLDIFGVPPYLAPGNTRFAVGALDLRAHDDTYFTPYFVSGPIQFPGAQNAKQGLVDVRWIPPATLERYQEPVPSLGWEPANQSPPMRTRYRITNADECAQAANAVADQAYVDLLYSSGYLNLVHLIATLRNEATDPDRSQTVSSEAWLRRKAGPSVSVTVNSEPIRFTGEVISSAATRAPYDYKATTWFTTQPLGRERKLLYRVFLRTLNTSLSLSGGSGGGEQEYGTYHQVGYAPDPARPAFQKLFTSTGIALDELKIAEGASVAEIREKSGTAVLKAVTFDWWVPTKTFGRRELSADALVKGASLRSLGWESAGNPAAPAGASGGAAGASSSSPLPATAIASSAALLEGVGLSDFIGWEDATEPAKHRRLAESRQIEIDYSLRWQADRLTISLANNRPADRNYSVFVVVEEILGSGQVLHTVERIPVTGQLTFVPQTYFDEEFEALARTARFFREFAQRYAKSLPAIRRPGGLGDPDPTVGRGDGWLGLDRELVASDPVLREFHRGSFTAQADFQRLADVALSHPAAANVLRQTQAEWNRPVTEARPLFDAEGYRDRGPRE